jgi:uncharacterized membrane protein
MRWVVTPLRVSALSALLEFYACANGWQIARAGIMGMLMSWIILPLTVMASLTVYAFKSTKTKRETSDAQSEHSQSSTPSS